MRVPSVFYLKFLEGEKLGLSARKNEKNGRVTKCVKNPRS